MPASVCDLDEVIAHRVVRAVWLAQVQLTAERMNQGQQYVMNAPDYRAYDAAAQVIAEFRESYLLPQRVRQEKEAVTDEHQD